MRMFSGLLAGMAFAVKSPDGKVRCELEDGRNLQMWFEGDASTYRRYSESALERQLQELFADLWRAHRYAHLTALSDRVGQTVRGDRDRTDPLGRQFVKERTAIQAEGRSTTGRIRLKTTGLTAWTVRISDGTIRQLDDVAFLSDLWTAFSSLMADYQRSIALLRASIYKGHYSSDM